MSSKWYILKNGVQLGPLRTKELTKLASSGALSPSDFVWKAGLAEWRRADQVKGLFSPIVRGQTAPLLDYSPVPQQPFPVEPVVSMSLYRRRTTVGLEARGAYLQPNWIIVAAGALTAIGFFLPWLSFGPLMSLNGPSVVNAAMKMGQSAFGILWLIPLLGSAVSGIELSSVGRKRQNVIAAALMTLAVLLMAAIIAVSAFSSLNDRLLGRKRPEGMSDFLDRYGSLFEVGFLDILGFFLQIGTVLCIACPVVVIIVASQRVHRR